MLAMIDHFEFSNLGRDYPLCWPAMSVVGWECWSRRDKRRIMEGTNQRWLLPQKNNRGVELESIRVSNQIRGLPSRGNQQREVLPTKLQGTILFNQRITSPREHSQQQTGLCGRVSPE